MFISVVLTTLAAILFVLFQSILIGFGAIGSTNGRSDLAVHVLLAVVAPVIVALTARNALHCETRTSVACGASVSICVSALGFFILSVSV